MEQTRRVIKREIKDDKRKVQDKRTKRGRQEIQTANEVRQGRQAALIGWASGHRSRGSGDP